MPDLGIKFIKAKIDTGARSSSLHAFDMSFSDRDGQRWVNFRVCPIQRNQSWVVEASAPVLETRQVRSSSGESQWRPVIKTPVVVMGLQFEIEVTLADRNQMGFRMLLGREAVRRRFLVAPGDSYLGGIPKRRRPSDGHRD